MGGGGAGGEGGGAGGGVGGGGAGRRSRRRRKATLLKHACWCQTGAGELESSIKEGTAEQAQLAKDIEEAKKSLAASGKNLAEATALREKEAAAFAKESADLPANILAMRGAVATIEKGVTEFLQMPTASKVRKLTIDVDPSNAALVL